MKITSIRVVGRRRTRFCRSRWSFGVCALLVATFFQFAIRIALAGDALDRPVTLDIPTNTPLDAALIEWGVKAGVVLMINTSTIEHQTTHGVHGTMPAGNALSVILRDSGLTYTAQGGRIHIVPMTALVRSAQREEQQSPPAASSSDNQVALNTANDAQESTEPRSTRTQNEASRNELETVVVTAQKREERLQDVPISMSVLGGQDLDKSTFSGVTDALSTVPGIATQADQYGGGTQISLRGVSNGAQLAGGSGTVAYYIDGVSFGLVRNSFVPDPNVYDLQQIEVLSGPQGTLYGANALNGVVRVLTHDADSNNFDFKVRASDSGTDGGGNNFRGDMAINVPIIDGLLAARATASYENDSGWIDAPLVKKAINDARLENYRLKLNAQPTEDLSIGLSAWHSRNEYGAPPLANANEQDPLVNYPEPIISEFNAYAFKVDDRFSRFSASSVTSYFDYSDSGVVSAGPVGVPILTAATAVKSRVVSEELNLTSNLEGPWRWSAGAFYRNARDHFDQIGTLYLAPVTTLLLDNFIDTSKSTALYGELGRRFFNDKLEFSVGGRYFHDDEGTQAVAPPLGETLPLTPFTTTSSATTPRAVLTWKPSANQMIYASYAQGFRSGIYQEEQVLVYLPNYAPVKPDRLINYELGTKGTAVNQRISYNLAVYFIDWRHIQQAITVTVPTSTGPTDLAPIVNGPSASGPGGEFAVTARPFDNLLLGANFSWNDLTFDGPVYSAGLRLFNTGDRTNFSPEYTAGGSVQYSFPLGGGGFNGRLSASANYVSSQIEREIPARSVVVLTGNSMLIGRVSFAVDTPDRWTVTLYGDNVTNDRGTPLPGTGFNGVAEVAEFDLRLRPRTIGIQFDYHLK